MAHKFEELAHKESFVNYWVLEYFVLLKVVAEVCVLEAIHSLLLRDQVRGGYVLGHSLEIREGGSDFTFMNRGDKCFKEAVFEAK